MTVVGTLRVCRSSSSRSAAAQVAMKQKESREVDSSASRARRRLSKLLIFCWGVVSFSATL